MKIMIGYNGSPEAWDALDLAQKYAKAFDAQIHVVSSMVGGSEDDKKKIEKAEENLEYTQNTLKESEIACKTHLLIRGLSPGEDLVKFAKETQIDLIVIGIQKRSKVGKLMFGSTAQYVILKASCPVLTVK